MRRLTGYRTLIGVLAICALMLAEMVLCLGSDNQHALEMFTALLWPQTTCAALLAGKSAASSLAGGGGLKGAIKSLLTESKPEAQQ